MVRRADRCVPAMAMFRHLVDKLPTLSIGSPGQDFMELVHWITAS